jgi:HNH endonuclease
MFAPPSSRKRSLQQRLDDRSILDPKTGCRLWTKARISGYGAIRVSGRLMGTHRAAWIARHGPIPPGLFVCHRCDTPLCINPGHLFLGTQKDNMADRAIKMRRRKKEAAQRETTTAPSLLRLEIMGREIITQILVVRPLREANALQSADDAPAPSPDGDARGRRPPDDL